MKLSRTVMRCSGAAASSAAMPSSVSTASWPRPSSGQGCLRMGELAGKLVFSPSRITYQISSMVKRGLVRKQPCAEDGRGQEAVLTEAGMAALVAAAPLHLATVRESFIDRVDPDELAVIGRVFDRISPTRSL